MAEIAAQDVAEAAVDPKARFTRGYRGWFMALMVVSGALAVMDRTALLTLGQVIKHDLVISDAQFGLLSGFAISAFYTLFGLVLARLADTTNRMKLVSLAIGLFSLFSALCGFVTSFIQLFVCRVIVGIGEGGVQPPTISAVSDLYPPQRRGTALSILSINIALGTLVGPIAAGYLAEAFSWRVVFYIVGGFGVVLALLSWATLREPPRGMSENIAAEHAAAPGFFVTLKHLAAKKSFWQIVIGMSVTSFASAGVGAFLPIYFTRQFDLSTGQTGLMFGGISFLSMLGGTVSGGVVADIISKGDGRWYVWLPALGLLCATPLYVGAFVLPNQVIALISLTIAGAALFLYYTPTQALLQNMVEPRMRGTAAYIFFLVPGLVGFGGGPAILGFISDRMAAHAFTGGAYALACPGGMAPAAAGAAAHTACRLASAAGLRIAMSLLSCLYVWAAIHFVLAARTVRADTGQ
jgi:MFS family permease